MNKLCSHLIIHLVGLRYISGKKSAYSEMRMLRWAEVENRHFAYTCLVKTLSASGKGQSPEADTHPCLELVIP